VIWLLASMSLASPEVLLETFETWAERLPQELVLDDVRPLRVVINAQDMHTYTARAEFGTLFSEAERHSRPGLVEVVVGDEQIDSSRFRNSASSRVGDVRQRPKFVRDDVRVAIERDLWITSDLSFKNAVKQYQVKRAALEQLGAPYPPDWSEAELADSVTVDTTEIDVDRLRDLVVEASAAFRNIDGLRTGVAEVLSTRGHYVLATSEGARLVQPERTTALYMWADLMTDDGLQLWDARTWLVDDPASLDSDAIAAAADALGRRVVARANAEPVDFYEGPVVFEGEAATGLFRYLAAPQLEGTPPRPRADRSYERLIRSGARVGRRLLPAGWSVIDDPRRFPDALPGAYEYDREGVAARSVELVDDGYVADLAMSRVPRKDLNRSNGHARGRVQSRWYGRLTHWVIEPARTASDRAFDKTVDRALRESGQDRLLVVRALGRTKPGGLPSPIHAVWRSVDGTETPVQALTWQNADRRVLRDIIAAAGRQSVGYMAPDMPDGTTGTIFGLPTALTGPERILVGELEAVFPGASDEPHVIPQPPLTAP